MTQWMMRHHRLRRTFVAGTGHHRLARTAEEMQRNWIGKSLGAELGLQSG